MNKKSFRRDNWPYSAAENLPEYNSVLVGCATCSTCCLHVRESVEVSMIQQKTFAWAATFVHKRTLYCIYSTVYIQAKCTHESVFHPAFKKLTGPFLYFSSFSVPPPPPLFLSFCGRHLGAERFYCDNKHGCFVPIYTHTVAPVFAPVQVLFRAHLFQA